MNNYLLAISIGPVQEFIAAARRTRDLWFGSYLLSEISKATAKSVQETGGALIFPAPTSPTDLEPAPDPDSALNVANIILAELLSGSDPQQVVRAAWLAAQKRWREFADPVFDEYRAVIQDEIWNEQREDVIEFCAAWLTSTRDYQMDRRRLMRLLAGRKACRDFRPANGHAHIPKSSLDGLRESVLRSPKEWPKNVCCRLRVSKGEQLDVVGLVKRTAGSHRPYPSVSRVAADAWIRGVGKDSLADLRAECQNLGTDILRPLNVSETGHHHFADFEYEGTAVYRSRFRELTEETGITDVEMLMPLSHALGNLEKQFGQASPYLAVLVADGDRMGQALSRLSSADDHRSFSQSLAQFANKARSIVHDHHGILVYAGGDDVLAFVPVDQSLKCAGKLNEGFAQLMQEWGDKTGTSLTLSVGLAIAHFMEPLEDLLNYGRAAEKHAKEPRVGDISDDGNKQSERDGLAVHVHKRGGGPIAVRNNWSSAIDEHLMQLAKWITSRNISGRVAYDLRQIAGLYSEWPADRVGDIICRDTLSILAGKQPRGEQNQIECVKQFVRDRVRDVASLRQISDELLIARQIAVAIQQAGGVSKPEEVLA